MPRDTDDDVEQLAGMTVADVFVEKGEDGFRDLERAAVAGALADHDGVLALGGGSVLDEGTRALLVGLHRGLPRRRHQGRRVEDRPQPGPPAAAGQPAGPVAAADGGPPSGLRGVASARVDTDGKTPDEVADEVVAAMTS